MTKFDFIIDEGLRKSLVSDYSELCKSIEAQNWKSAVVMAGSVIEAVLIDYLLSVNYKPKKGMDLLKVHLPELIEFSKDSGLITGEEVNVLVTIKDYRNLIHPGKSVRLSKLVDEDTAIISKGVVGKISKLAEENQKNRYGLTAEQLLQKIIGDSSAHVMLDGLMEKTAPGELKNLLINLIPKNYIELEADSYFPSSELTGGVIADVAIGYLLPRSREAIDKMLRLEICYHQIFEKMTEKNKGEVIVSFVDQIKTLDKAGVERAIKIFFRAEYLEFVDPSSRLMMLNRILEMFKENTDIKLLTATKKILKYISSNDMKKLINALFEQVIANKLNLKLEELKNYLMDVGNNAPYEMRTEYNKLLEVWLIELKKKKPVLHDMVVDVCNKFIDIPF